MKRTGLVFLLVLLSTTGGNAQQSHDVEISVGAGVAFPSSPMTFADYWQPHYGLSAGAGVPLSESVTLTGSVEYQRFTLDEAGVSGAIDTDYLREIWAFEDVTTVSTAGSSSATTLSANVRVSPSGLSGLLSPYVTAGLGVRWFTLGEIQLATTSTLSVNGSHIPMTANQTVIGGTETSALMQVGLGVDIRAAASFDIFVEARYAFGLTREIGAAYVPLMAGARFRL